MLSRSGARPSWCGGEALLKKIKKRVLVGDEVALSGVDWVENRGMIDDVVERQCELLEPPIANVDQALTVLALARRRAASN